MMQGPLTRISPSSAMRTCTLAMGFPELPTRSEEHTSELQSQSNLVCRLLLEKKNACAAHAAPDAALETAQRSEREVGRFQGQGQFQRPGPKRQGLRRCSLS